MLNECSLHRHLDNHHLWEPNEFAVSCFRIIMYSIQVRSLSLSRVESRQAAVQLATLKDVVPLLSVVVVQAQHSHHVIQQVLNHLDTHNRNTPRVRAGIVQVLLETVAIAAKGSVGE